jgi:magnesium transporter
MEHSVSFVPQLSPQEIAPKILIEQEELTDHDIYRGAQYPPSRASGPDSVTSQSPSFTASSNSFRLAGGRLGAIATRLERAITRWARANWADSSSSLNSDTSSESSRSSFRTANKSIRRKRRRPSLADIQQRALSERTVAARLRAREARRTVPREFNLYSPTTNDPSQEHDPVEERQQAVRTFSLDLILPDLESLLRRHGKSRRPRHRGRTTVTELGHPHQSLPHHPHQGRAPRDGASKVSRTDAPDGAHRLEKGKDKMLAVPSQSNLSEHPSVPLRDLGGGKPPPAWWLDVSNPSWEDMRTLGRVSTSFHLHDSRANSERQLLHLHPLTLEDILQREPREKLELFPKLGYYFIVFRALEASTAPERLDTVSQKTGSSQPPDHGVVNEINVYLVVFRGGICTVSRDRLSMYSPFINKNNYSFTFRTSQVNDIHDCVAVTQKNLVYL